MYDDITHEILFCFLCLLPRMLSTLHSSYITQLRVCVLSFFYHWLTHLKFLKCTNYPFFHESLEKKPQFRISFLIVSYWFCITSMLSRANLLESYNDIVSCVIMRKMSSTKAQGSPAQKVPHHAWFCLYDVSTAHS